MPNLASLQPLSLYICLPLFVAFPWDVAYLRSRMLFLSTLRRVLLPVQAVTLGVSVTLVFLRTFLRAFSETRPALKEIFIADIMTSLAKTGSDIERAICSMVSNLLLFVPSPDRISGIYARPHFRPLGRC